MEDFFHQFDQIVDDFLPKLAKLHHHKAAFLKAFESFFSHPFKDRTWPEIFNGRMLTSKTILPPDRVDAYLKILRAYIDLLTPTDKERKKPLKKTEANNLRVATDLVSHLSLHRMDPDNSLLALTPSLTLLEKHCRRLQRAYENVDKDIKPLTTAELKAEALILRVMKWSELDNAEEIANQVKQFAYQVLTNISINVGDIVMCRCPKNSSSETSEVETDEASTSGFNQRWGAALNISEPEQENDETSQDDYIEDLLSQPPRLLTSAQHNEWMFCRVYRVLPNSIVVHNHPLESKAVVVANSNVIPLD